MNKKFLAVALLTSSIFASQNIYNPGATQTSITTGSQADQTGRNFQGVAPVAQARAIGFGAGFGEAAMPRMTSASANLNMDNTMASSLPAGSSNVGGGMTIQGSTGRTTSASAAAGA